jgi:hypothetical protein
MRALVAGERDPQHLAALRNSRCQKEANESAMALPGTWRKAPRFVLTPARARCDFYTPPLSACDAQIERAFSVIQPRLETTGEGPDTAPLSTPPRRHPLSHRKNAPAVNTRAHLLRSTGVARVAVPGRSDSLAQTMVSEMGTAMRKGPATKPFGSWLGLAPHNDISGAKVLQSRTMKKHHRAAHAFRMAAQSVPRSHCALGAFSRRLQGRLGPAQALVAPAHKRARTVYDMLQHRVP